MPNLVEAQRRCAEGVGSRKRTTGDCPERCGSLRCRSTQTHHRRLELVAVARIRPVLPALSAESHRFLLPLTVPGLLRDCSKVQVARARPLFPPSSQFAEETHHTVPTRCRVLVGTSAHPPTAFSRRRASAPMHRRVALTQLSAVWWWDFASVWSPLSSSSPSPCF